MERRIGLGYRIVATAVAIGSAFAMAACRSSESDAAKNVARFFASEIANGNINAAEGVLALSPSSGASISRSARQQLVSLSEDLRGCSVEDVTTTDFRAARIPKTATITFSEGCKLHGLIVGILDLRGDNNPGIYPNGFTRVYPASGVSA